MVKINKPNSMDIELKQTAAFLAPIVKGTKKRGDLERLRAAYSKIAKRELGRNVLRRWLIGEMHPSLGAGLTLWMAFEAEFKPHQKTTKGKHNGNSDIKIRSA